VEEYADEVFGLLNEGAHMYFCGLKGMMPGILEMLERVAKEKGINFEEFVEKLKHNNQWHVEVSGGVLAGTACRNCSWLDGAVLYGFT
jgi:ferredoxin--NADP+ reductase